MWCVLGPVDPPTREVGDVPPPQPAGPVVLVAAGGTPRVIAASALSRRPPPLLAGSEDAEVYAGNLRQFNSVVYVGKTRSASLDGGGCCDGVDDSTIELTHGRSVFQVRGKEAGALANTHVRVMEVSSGLVFAEAREGRPVPARKLSLPVAELALGGEVASPVSSATVVWLLDPEDGRIVRELA